jgi:hypothetical protein
MSNLKKRKGQTRPKKNGDRNNSKRPTAVSESGNHPAEHIALAGAQE